MSPRGHFEDLNDLPSWEQYFVGAESLVNALKINDPEDTLMVQLTFPEVCTITMGLVWLSRVHPEFEPAAARLSEKLREVSSAQEFLSRERTLGDE